VVDAGDDVDGHRDRQRVQVELARERERIETVVDTA
jgi:hypothetical protein